MIIVLSIKSDFKGGIFMELVKRKKNVQIYPARTLCFPNDRFTKVLFNLSNDDFRYVITSQESVDLMEMKNHKKFGKIVSSFKLYTGEGEMFTISEPLDQFDCAVLTVCTSEFNVGNRYITPAIIYRGLTGKVGRGDAEPSKDQLANIIRSVEKLMRLRIDIVMNDICEKFNYNEGNRFHIVANLLPCEYTTTTTINGRKANVIHLLEASPIWQIARLKNQQVISCEAELLDIPQHKNSRLNIMVKFYVLRRVLEIIAHKMTASIRFADVFRKCRIERADGKTKLRVREFMVNFFEHLRGNKVIKNYSVNKEGGRFYSVSISY